MFLLLSHLAHTHFQERLQHTNERENYAKTGGCCFMAPVLHFHRQLAIHAPSSGIQVTNTLKKKMLTNFILPSQNSSFSELQGRLEVEVQGKQGF